MFESLSDRLGKIFEGLRGRGALSENDVGEALREVYGGSLVAEYDKQGMLQVRWAR